MLTCEENFENLVSDIWQQKKGSKLFYMSKMYPNDTIQALENESYFRIV